MEPMTLYRSHSLMVRFDAWHFALLPTAFVQLMVAKHWMTSCCVARAGKCKVPSSAVTTPARRCRSTEFMLQRAYLM